MPPKKKGSEIQIARGRLKGALQDLVAPSDDEQSDESEKKYPVPTRGRPPKRSRKEPEEVSSAGPVHESYIMKLFDRSLDLAKYNENTPLYPICRAWIADQPRSSSIRNLRNQRSPSPEKREEGEDLVKEFKNGTIDEVTSMPAVKKFHVPRVPSPTDEQRNADKNDIDLDYDLKSPLVTKDVLLLAHQRRWKNVRSKWMNQTKTHQQKYVTSFELLEALYKG